MLQDKTLYLHLYSPDLIETAKDYRYAPLEVLKTTLNRLLTGMCQEKPLAVDLTFLVNNSSSINYGHNISSHNSPSSRGTPQNRL